MKVLQRYIKETIILIATYNHETVNKRSIRITAKSCSNYSLTSQLKELFARHFYRNQLGYFSHLALVSKTVRRLLFQIKNRPFRTELANLSQSQECITGLEWIDLLPNLPKSPSPHEKTLPQAVSASVCASREPHATWITRTLFSASTYKQEWYGLTQSVNFWTQNLKKRW